VDLTMGRTAIVTGGTGGLGAAVTRRLLADGWRVVVPWFAERELDRVEEHERLDLVQADLTDPGSAANVAEAAGADLGALVNLVGGFAMGERLHETPIDDFEWLLRLNLRPTYLMSAAALPAMLAAGSGSIVCVSARPAVQPFAGAAGYITAKAAVLAFVDVLDAEYRSDGIRANAIMPSVIDTPANRESQPDADHDRWVRPAEIARVIAFLCSDDASVTSGAHIPVYGRA
jgi:NAD(P)-dependent dehydrogenase (short-subunit alcohol dehydrogenase family)